MATAQAQSGMNRDTAQAQQLTNMYDQVTPDYTSTWTRTGENTYIDSTGKAVTIPKFMQETKLSDGQQQIYDIGQQTEKNIAAIGRDQSSRIGDLLGRPMQLGNEATEARLFDLATKRLDPQLQRDEEALRTRLANSGLRAGSAAWDAEMGQFNQRRNDAYNSLMLSGRGVANQEIAAERNQPINEITALLSNSQVSQPNFMSTPQTGVAGVDYSGLVRDKYNADMNMYNQRMAQNNAMMGGLFGLTGAAATAGIKYSDERLKTDIQLVGKLKNGLNVYLYRMKDSDVFEIGLLAQEVQSAVPDAVQEVDGYKAVDYKKAALSGVGGPD
jgi:hypothetical protein